MGVNGFSGYLVSLFFTTRWRPNLSQFISNFQKNCNKDMQKEKNNGKTMLAKLKKRGHFLH